MNGIDGSACPTAPGALSRADHRDVIGTGGLHEVPFSVSWTDLMRRLLVAIGNLIVNLSDRSVNSRLSH